MSHGQHNSCRDCDERGASATAAGTTLTWHFTAPHVNDFAFAVSRDYVSTRRARTFRERFIPVYALYLAQHTNYRTNNTVYGGARALEEHSRFLFPYDFSQGTIADGPETGMEYPMIIFNSSGVSTAVHEFGHQWFPMMVGSNETRYGWMDEGLNDFIDVSAVGQYHQAAAQLSEPFGWISQSSWLGAGSADDVANRLRGPQRRSRQLQQGTDRSLRFRCRCRRHRG